jgi:mRNA-degrading endonuclease toxin of MazEF toxin-antitoxin module
MKRNDIYEYTLGNRRCRIAIISADPYNPDRATFALILGPDTPPPPSAAVVALTSADPARGSINVTRLRVLDPDSTGAHIGRLSPTTIGHLEQALRTYLGLL